VKIPADEWDKADSISQTALENLVAQYAKEQGQISVEYWEEEEE
jgi:hypothetical protein